MRPRPEILQINPDHPEPDKIKYAAEIILNEGIIVYPTETVYGLGCSAFSKQAIESIFQLKQREKGKPLIVIISNKQQLTDLTKHIHQKAKQLIDLFWPGPLTIIFSARPDLNKALLGNNDTIAIRIPGSEICLELLNRCGVPIISTSANISGAENPVNVKQVLSNIPTGPDLIIDGGETPSDTPSTIIDCSKEHFQLIRIGAISKNAIEEVIGTL